jgi:arginine-tRNA-protein transferase
MDDEEKNLLKTLHLKLFWRISSPIHETYKPEKISSWQFGYLLATGWWNYGTYFTKHNFVIQPNDTIVGIVLIRANIPNFTLTKSLRRIWNKCSKFHVVIQEVRHTEEKLALFAQHTQRFTTMRPVSLDDVIPQDPALNYVPAKEFCVYDEQRLIAVSYAYIGENAMSSIYAMYDEAYASYSLGIYTMLLETSFCKEHNITHYYPGYIHDEPSPFDYKKRLPALEYYDFESGHWYVFDKNKPNDQLLTS